MQLDCIHVYHMSFIVIRCLEDALDDIIRLIARELHFWIVRRSHDGFDHLIRSCKHIKTQTRVIQLKELVLFLTVCPSVHCNIIAIDNDVREADFIAMFLANTATLAII